MATQQKDKPSLLVFFVFFVFLVVSKTSFIIKVNPVMIKNNYFS